MDGGEPEVSGMGKLGGNIDGSYFNSYAGAPPMIPNIPSSVGPVPHPRPAGPVERTLAESHGHRLVIGRDMDAYDMAPAPHGRFYIGKAQSDADAVSRWRGWLRSQGVDE